MTVRGLNAVPPRRGPGLRPPGRSRARSRKRRRGRAGLRRQGAGFAALEQRAIEALLIARAMAGKHVVRLKGGDPYVFGRGGEEVAALVAAGIPVEVVPGVSAATAVPASAGIPVTHRELVLVADDRHRSRRSDKDRSQRRLGLAGGLPGHAGDPDGASAAPAHLRPADGRWPLSGYPGRRDRSRHAPRSAGRHGATGEPSRGRSRRRNSSRRRSSSLATSFATASCWRHPRSVARR